MSSARAKPALDALHTVSPLNNFAPQAPYNSSIVISLALMAHV